jgi:hypothetical protein
MTADDLIAIGFENRGSELRAPAGSSICLVPLNGSRCLRVRIELPSGNALTFVVAQVALRIEEAKR